VEMMGKGRSLTDQGDGQGGFLGIQRKNNLLNVQHGTAPYWSTANPLRNMHRAVFR
jgi:hypothetical protein